MAQLTPWLVQKFYETDGVTPAVGHKIFTYEPGTSTKKATYQSNGGSANTNPIITDANGEANIWLTGAYKIVQAPANDTDPPAASIKTWDDVGEDSADGNLGIVDTINDLRALSDGEFEVVQVMGFEAVGDKSTGFYRWDSTSGLSDDELTIIIPDNYLGNGRWIRIYFEDYKPANLTALRALYPGSLSFVYLGGHTTAGDGGEGLFYWDSTSTDSDDGGTIIAPSEGGTGRWIRAYKGYVNAKWFGVKGDGLLTDDDETKIQACLDIGKNVYIPDGTYILTDALTISNSDIIITGESYNTILQPTVDIKDCFQATSQSNIQITNLSIVFDVSSQTTGTARGIALLNCYDCKIDRVKIDSCGSFAIDCRDLLAGKDEQSHIISDCYITNSGLYGINIQSDTASDIGKTLIKDNYIENSGNLNDSSGRGILVGMNNCIIINNTIDGATEYGIRVFSSATIPSANDNIIEHNTIRNVGDGSGKSEVYSIYLYAESTGTTKNTIVKYNKIENVGTLSANDVGITMAGNDSSLIEGNTISGTQGVGVSVSTFADGYNIIKDNYISGIDKGITSSYNVANGNHSGDTITNNYISVTTVGIQLSTNPYPYVKGNNITVSGTDPNDYGIRAPSLTNENIEGNVVVGGDYCLSYSSTSKGFVGNNYLSGAGTDLIDGDPQNLTGGQLYFDKTVSTTATYYGVYNTQEKTSGVTDGSDNMWGQFIDFIMNQSGGTIGALRAAYSRATLTLGTIASSIFGLVGIAKVDAGTVEVDVYGSQIQADINAGTVSGDVYGTLTDVDIESGCTLSGDVFGHYVKVDADTDPTGSAYGIYIDDLSNVDYAIYQKGANPNKLNGLLERSAQNNITASTTQSQGEQPLTLEINRVTTVANANDVVTLPAAAPGRRIVVINVGANTLQIFPASGDAIDAGIVDASTTLATDTKVVFDCCNNTNWYST